MNARIISRAATISTLCACVLALGACGVESDDAPATGGEHVGWSTKIPEVRYLKQPPPAHHDGRRGECTSEDAAVTCDDHDPCTQDTCEAGKCEHAALTCGTSCSLDERRCGRGGGESGVCDGSGMCVAPGRLLWDRTFDFASARGVAAAPNGDIYVAGVFSGGIVDLGTGPLTPGIASGIFLARYDAAGTIQWAEALGTTASDVFVSGVAVDPWGNVAITGVFDGTLDFGTGPITSVGSSDAFLAKFDPSGAALWTRRLGGPGFSSGRSVASDAAGDFAVTGYFDGTIDFGAGPVPAVPGNEDAFLAKYDGSGNLLWAKRFGDADQQIAWDVAMDPAGDVAFTGFMAGTIDFGGGPITAPDVQASFAAEFDPAGALRWGSVFGLTGAAAGRGVAFTPSGAVILTGEFHGTIDFGTGVLTSVGEQDLYVAKIDPSGHAVWSERFGDPSAFLESADVAVDALGDVFATGDFTGTVDFGTGPLSTGASPTTYVLKLDPAGTTLWSRSFLTDSFDRPFGIAVDGCEEIVVGELGGTVDFGNGPRTAPNGAAYVTAFGP